ncbi:alpha/beta hydrolase [Sporobolomyces salmoneus]|uniref:alpha/beta hydrolase n=1 Tax=Sporobolomyces salmoneus TaxID=183962 RepID=UPI003175B6DE
MSLPSFRSLFKWFAATVALSLGGVGVGLYLGQNKLIYPSGIPAGSRENVPTPDQFGMPSYEELTLTTPDRVKIKAFLMLYERDGIEAKDRPTVLLLHANAGNVGHRLPIAKVFHNRMRCNVLALSYRGYGKSEGTANEKGIKLDAQTALDYILSHEKLEKTKIWLYGQSIGGAVSIFLASQNAQRVDGLIVENTFLSLPKLVPHVLPFLSPFVPFLLHQIWPSEQYISTLPKDFPVLFLAGSRDELVEPGQMRELFRVCGSENKEWKEFEYGTHNDTCIQPKYFDYIATFIAQHSNLPLLSSFSSTSAPTPSSEKPTISTESTSKAASEISSPTESSTSSSIESFEMIDASRSQEVFAAGMGAGSLGPKEELKELESEAEEKLKEWKDSKL